MTVSLTSVIRYAQALDSAATDGAGKTGLTNSDVTAKYLVQGGTLTSLTVETITTLGTYQAPSSAAHIRLKELAGSDPTKGIYEIHFHNTQVQLSGKRLWLFLSATGAAFQPLEVDLSDIADRLPEIAPDTAGGLPTTSYYSPVTTIDANVVTWAGETATVDGGNLPNVNASAISSSTPATAIKDQVVAALSTDTYAEPGQGTPAATNSLAAKINYLFKGWRNKVTQTATTYSLFADDAATVDQKASVSDDGTTFTRGEITTGP